MWRSLRGAAPRAAAAGAGVGVDVEVDSPLQEAGVDSLSATALKADLQDKFGRAVNLPNTLMFDYPTVGALSTYIVEQLQSTLDETAEIQSKAGAFTVAAARREIGRAHV